MQQCIEFERKDALCFSSIKKTNDRDISMTENPQLKTMHGLKNVGISLLKIFPMCFEALSDPTHRALLVQPVRALCRDLTSAADLELLFCWANSGVVDSTAAPVLDMKTQAEVTASSGTPSKVFDGVPDSSWACQGGKLSISLKTPQSIAAVTFAWVPNELVLA